MTVKMSEEGKRVKWTKLWATMGSKLAKMIVERQQKSSSSTTELYGHTQPSTYSPELHQGPRLLLWIASGLEKSSQQNQTTQCCLILEVETDSALMYLFVWAKKLNFLSWGDKTGFCRCSHQYTYSIRIILMNVRHVHRNFCFKFGEACKLLEVLFN